MAFNTLAQIVTRFRKDVRNIIDSDTAVEWANDAQEDIFSIDCPLFEKRKTDFESSEDTYSYAISGVGTDVRKIKEIFLDLGTLTDPYSEDYVQKNVHRYKFLDFNSDDTNFYLSADPDGRDLTVVYYRTPTAITTLGSSIDLPTRWKKGIYLGMMAQAQMYKYQMPSGDWEAIFQQYKDRIDDSESVQNTGANTVEPYSLI